MHGKVPRHRGLCQEVDSLLPRSAPKAESRAEIQADIQALKQQADMINYPCWLSSRRGGELSNEGV